MADYIGAFAVTAGLNIEKKLAEFEKSHDDYNAIMLKALADRLAEAFAELLHQRVRREFWGYAADEALDNDGADRARSIAASVRRPAIRRARTTPRRAPLFDLLRAPRSRHHADRVVTRCCRPPR